MFIEKHPARSNELNELAKLLKLERPKRRHRVNLQTAEISDLKLIDRLINAGMTDLDISDFVNCSSGLIQIRRNKEN